MRLNVVLIDDFEEHVHDLVFDKFPQCHEFAIDAMQDCLQVVSLTWVFTIKQLKEAADKILRQVPDDHVRAQVWRQDELKEKLVDELQVRPGVFQVRLVFVRVHRARLLVVYSSKPSQLISDFLLVKF